MPGRFVVDPKPVQMWGWLKKNVVSNIKTVERATVLRSAGFSLTGFELYRQFIIILMAQ